MRTGIANLPLHNGNAPKWLYKRMVNLLVPLSKIMIDELGEDKLLERISNPFWFQSLGCALGYDWHSSGLTTVLTAAMKEAFAKSKVNIIVCGGKGKSALNTPNEIMQIPWDLNKEDLVTKSRLIAKVDNSLIQAGYTIYHHAFFITKNGKWAVVQQGMNTTEREARRYHWLYTTQSMIIEPHSGIDGIPKENVLNMTSKLSINAQKISVDLIKNPQELKYALMQLDMPKHHFILSKDLSQKTFKELLMLSNPGISNYEELVLLKGIGPAGIRALALISELIYGEKPSYEDPVKFSFAHGGKDGTPYKVNRKLYDETISFFENIANKSKDYNLLKNLSKIARNVTIVD